MSAFKIISKSTHCLLALLLLAFLPASAGVATVFSHPEGVQSVPGGILVTTFDDEMIEDGDCSLREALRSANLNSPFDQCPAGNAISDVILLPSGVYTMTIGGVQEDSGLTGDFDVLGDLELIGSGRDETIIDGNQLDRLLHVPANVNLVARHLTLRNGLVSNQIPNQGGAVLNMGTALLLDVTVKHSAVIYDKGSFDEPRGGGIYNGRSMNLIHVLVDNNAAEYRGNAASVPGVCGSGAGIFNAAGALAGLLNSTIRGNTAGGLETCDGLAGGIFNSGELTLERSTVASNQAGGAMLGGSAGGGIYNADGILHVINSTISDNTAYGLTAAGGGIAIDGENSSADVTAATIAGNATPHISGSANIYLETGGDLSISASIVAGSTPNCSGVEASHSGGDNLESPGNSCGFGATGDAVDVPPDGLGLLPLAENFPGSTPTRALDEESQAIDAVLASCQHTDQRVVLRGTPCDKGAYEYDASILPGWEQSGVDGLGDRANESFPSLAVYNGYLYAGSENSHGAQVWRTVDGHSWEQSAVDGIGNPANTRINTLQEYGGSLFAGTTNQAAGAEVWRYDGSSWQPHSTGGFGDAGNTSIQALVVYDGYLYASASHELSGVDIYRYDGTAWQPALLNGDGDPYNVAAPAMVVYQGALYIAVQNNLAGARLWSFDGSQWTMLAGNGEDNVLLDMVVYQDAIYTAGNSGGSTAAAVWRYDGAWSKISLEGFGTTTDSQVTALGVYGDALYALNSDPYGAVTAMRYDGQHWDKAAPAGFKDLGNSAGYTLQEFQQRLFAGLDKGNLSGGEIWLTGWRLFMPVLFQAP